MEFIAFSNWVSLREQQAAAQVQTPIAGLAKPSPVDGEIKQAIVANMGKGKQARLAAITKLAKKKQNDPKVTSKDMNAIADAMPDGSQR